VLGGPNKGLCIRSSGLCRYRTGAAGRVCALLRRAYTGLGFPLIGRARNRYQGLVLEDLCEGDWRALTLDGRKVNDTFKSARSVSSMA
jgi:hypothetical protein